MFKRFQISKFPSFQVSKEGGREGGKEEGPLRGLGTKHVISGSMRGLKKYASDGADRQTNRQTSGHHDSMTESAQWGCFSENHYLQTSVSFG